jgi:diguanylate cyclase
MLAANFEFDLLTLLLLSACQMSVGAALGIFLGWFLKRPRSPVSLAPDGNDSARSQRVNDAMVQLQILTTAVGENVGQHSKKVDSIQHDLTIAEDLDQGGTQASVLAALANIKSANHQLQKQLHAAENKLQEQAERLNNQTVQARTDALTDLANRRAFDDSLDRLCDEFHRTTSPFCLMMIDVDHFKKINDTHGHLAGDEVLRCVARALSDSSHADAMVNRFGGEEFAILLPAVTLDQACSAAEAARAAIEAAACEFAGVKFKMTASVGLASVLPGDSTTALIERADVAMYAAKKAGRNQVYLHDGANCHSALPESQADAAESQSIAAKDHSLAKAGSPPWSKEFQTDALTGLPNQAIFESQLNQRLSEGRRSPTPLAVALLDVDGMRALNATHGIAAGDKVLRVIAQFLKAALREADLVARIEDDRFALLLPSTKLADASLVVERVRAAIRRCDLNVDDHEITFTISSGLTAAESNDDIHSLTRRAIQALRIAKREGPNCSRVHNGERVTVTEARRSAEPAVSV